MRIFHGVVAVLAIIMAIVNFATGDIGWGVAMIFCALINGDAAVNN